MEELETIIPNSFAYTLAENVCADDRNMEDLANEFANELGVASLYFWFEDALSAIGIESVEDAFVFGTQCPACNPNHTYFKVEDDIIDSSNNLWELYSKELAIDELVKSFTWDKYFGNNDGWMLRIPKLESAFVGHLDGRLYWFGERSEETIKLAFKVLGDDRFNLIEKIELLEQFEMAYIKNCDL